MAMCPRENDVSAISRKFAGITRVFLSPPSPLLPPLPPASCLLLPCHFSLPLLRSCFFFFSFFILFFTFRVHVRARARAHAERYERAISRTLFAGVNGRTSRARERTHFAGTRVCFHSRRITCMGCIGYQYLKGDRGSILCTRACISVGTF